jgi:hypothetical protein
MPTVDQRLRQLRGAPRQKYLEKWQRWLEEIIPRDKLQEILDIEGFLLERCSGLDDSECYQEISLEFRGKARETDYFEQVCRYQQALKEQLNISDAQEALKIMEETDDPDIIASIDQFIRNRFICLYSLDIDIEYGMFPRGIPTEVMREDAAIQLIEYLGYGAGGFNDVWDFSRMRRYRIIIIRDRLRLCKVYHNYDEGIYWISNCSYILLNDRKRTFYLYRYKYG